MKTAGRLMLAGAMVAGSAGSVLAQAPEPATPDLARLADGKGAQVFNRTPTVATGTAARCCGWTRGRATAACC
jgi:hypothetical protein